MKRFLFVISDTGGGHRAPAVAVRDEMARLYGDEASVDLADIFIELGCWPYRHFPRWYPRMTRWRGVPWGVGSALSDHADFMETASTLSYAHARSPLRSFLRRHPADVVVSFHPLPNYVLMRAVHRERLGVPVAVVVVDLVSVHAGWFAPGAHTYFVPTEMARERALKWNVPAGRIEVVGGMPVRRAFAQAAVLSKSEARSQLGLPQDRSVVLILGGGQGMGPLEPVVRAIVEERPRAHLVAVAGRNEDLRDRLRSLYSRRTLSVQGFVPDMQVWMRAADILVTKAGSNSLSEAFVCGLPVVLFAALPGQEEGNVAYVVENSAGIWAQGPKRAARAVMELLGDPRRLESLAERGRSIACPEAAETLARRLWRIAQTARRQPASYSPTWLQRL